MYSMIDTAFPSHRKVRTLERTLGESNATVVGRMVKLWVWSLSNAEDGTVSKQDAWLLEDAAGWNGSEGEFVDALVKVGFLDAGDSDYSFHDWAEYGGRVSEAKRRERERGRARRASQKEGQEERVSTRGEHVSTTSGTRDNDTRDAGPEADRLAQIAFVEMPESESTLEDYAKLMQRWLDRTYRPAQLERITHRCADWVDNNLDRVKNREHLHKTLGGFFGKESPERPKAQGGGIPYIVVPDGYKADEYDTCDTE